MIISETGFRKKPKISAVNTVIFNTFSLGGSRKQRPTFSEWPIFFIFMIVPQKETFEDKQIRHLCSKIGHNHSFVYLRDQITD